MKISFRSRESLTARYKDIMKNQKMKEKTANERAEMIKNTLLGYVAAESTSNSPAERLAEKYFLDYFSKQKYFAENPKHCEAYPIDKDAFGRAAVWAMARGEGEETIVMIHHYDVVTAEDYKSLKDIALK